MRASGVLMHITSLPSSHGIGTMGREAYQFIDFLKKAGQRYWQILPLTPTGYGDSPYQSCSAYGGNHYLIDLDMLAEQDLLLPEEISACDWGGDSTRVDFGLLYKSRLRVLRKAYARFRDEKQEFARFRAENDLWLPEFAHFMALKAKFDGKPWYEWEESLKFRDPRAIDRSFCELSEEIQFYCFVQYLFHMQWTALRAYAHEAGIAIIGDVPIYVPYDSVEVWCEPALFDLDESLTPIEVAGCPPDGFNEDGQLWGNPLYRWERHKEDGYRWWMRRLNRAAEWYDMIRLDHFRGFAGYYAVPFGDATARNGRWLPGPGLDFMQAVKQELPDTPLIAEDLGFLTPDVHKLREDAGYPGMKVLEFAFDGGSANPYLPYNYTPNTVCYTGTHDNMPLKQWFEETDAEATDLAKAYAGPGEDPVWGMIRLCMASVSELAVVLMQDYLELGRGARMNFPGICDGSNWTWRAEALPGDALAARIRGLTELYGRL